MADTLPHPNAGLPWNAITQPPQQAQGVNPILQALMQQRTNRIKGEQDFRNMAVSQSAGLAPALGGIGSISMIEALARNSGMEDFRINPAYAMINDPAQFQATNAQATANMGAAFANAASGGVGLDVRADNTIRSAGPLGMDALSAVIQQKAASAPKYDINTNENKSGQEHTDRREGIRFTPEGGAEAYDETIKQTEQQTQQERGPGVAPPGALNPPTQQQSPSEPTPEEQGAAQDMGLSPEATQRWHAVNAALQTDPRFGPGTILVVGDDRQFYAQNIRNGTRTPLSNEDLQQIHVVAQGQG